ncbi:hypothetical protein MAIC_31640 [Mycolicibacterium aichiense]|uniref:Uncharacterized protein n=1 Tax=Mycolicibacterium aichiense TaxID=1799 RepID=A0AAD1HSB1_9MYCO|nr:hypothetical protein MAIC_31640 [Mycolicibacterium aichiense]
MALHGSVGGEYLDHQSAAPRSLNQVGALGQKAPSTTTPGVALQFYCSRHPGGSFSECL